MEKAADHLRAMAINKALDTKYRFSTGISTFRELIDNGTFIAKKITLESSVKYNRIKFNRMDADQQAEYEKKLAIKKTVYNLCYDENTSIECSKAVYDYANLPEQL